MTLCKRILASLIAALPLLRAGADAAAEVRANLAAMPRPWQASAYRPASPEAEIYSGRVNVRGVEKLTWPLYQAALRLWSEKYEYVRLETVGYSLENDPIYAISITNPKIPDDQKFHLLLTANHSGAERSGLHAMMAVLEYLVSDQAARYRDKYEIRAIPCGNIFGFFRSEAANNSRKIDPYAAGRGSFWDVPRLTPKKTEDTPEIVAMMKVVDEFQPEIMLDFHGVGRSVPGEIMTQYIGGAGSNHSLLPWARRLVEAARAGAKANGSPAWPCEENLQRLTPPPAALPEHKAKFRDSGAYFYSPMYPYLKCHTAVLFFEIGYEAMAVGGVRGILDFGLNPPPDLHGSLPVDNVRTDWGGFLIQAWGVTPGERRRSRVELWNRNDAMISMVLAPPQTYRIVRAAAFGPEGLKEIYGQTPVALSLNLKSSGLFENRADTGEYSWSAIRQFIKLGPEVNFTHANAINFNELSSGVPPQHGIAFAIDIQLPAQYRPELLDIRLNGFTLPPDARDGYELFPHDFGWRLRVNVPPEKSQRMRSYFITCAYRTDAPVAWGWQIPAEVKTRAQTLPDLRK